ncbi:MAG: AP2 domain-containing protein [Akkermansiaceae bacterium]|jgi:hypothetical protein|nr:AP2 domain-containing protein [Akkermansiaceae bacterium]
MDGLADNFGITRMERAVAGTFGWQVRLRRHGVKHAKYFADRAHGGWQASLRAARAWRDQLLGELAAAERSRVCAPSPRNSSGVVGVAKITVRGPQGVVYHFWQATWCPSPGERRSVRFSVKRHGDEVAFRLAVEARRNGIGG